MLNERDLSLILGRSLPPLLVKDIHWKSQDSTQESILFYKILPGQKAHEDFLHRIQNCHFAWLVVNADHESRPINSSIIPESEWPQIQKRVLDELYPLPKMKLLAVTGTNGKTTTADLVLQLGELSGKRGLSIGTLGVRENNKTLLDFGLTSPSFIDLRKFLFKYGQDKDFCIMEASSHALDQQRLFGLKFDNAGWLSFSQDHLDYHNTMEEYFAAKLMLVDHLKEEGFLYLPPSQTELFERIMKATQKVRFAREITQDLPLFFSTSFNRNNLEVAVELIERTFSLNVPNHFDQIIPPDGRFYIRPYGTNFIVVDFAHTPDALENICKGIKETFPAHRLKVLFGCGGDRDRSKRPLMGKIAEAYADEIYVTSDNPRNEDPDRIIDDIVSGMSTNKIHRITERPKAVERAFQELTTNEILLLAGKGHEDYILINGVKHPYSDIEEVEMFLLRNKA
jgi:UDP-N-acetylmuramoyl-L-alanyl-D-glutamate--2,6-diaminopimelate ligase